METQTHEGETRLPLPPASAVCGITDQFPGTHRAPDSPTPLTGSEQLGWPPRKKKKMPVGLAGAAGQASPVVSGPPPPTKSPELGVPRALEAEAPGKQSDLSSGAIGPSTQLSSAGHTVGFPLPAPRPKSEMEPSFGRHLPSGWSAQKGWWTQWRLGEASRKFTKCHGLG